MTTIGGSRSRQDSKLLQMKKEVSEPDKERQSSQSLQSPAKRLLDESNDELLGDEVEEEK